MLPPRVLVPLVLSVALCGAQLPRDYGEVVVAGGKLDTENSTSSVETVGGVALPDLPEPVHANTLTLVDHVLYNCHGHACYTLNTSSSDPQWLQTVTLPEYMNYHTAVAVGSHIWLMQNNFIYDLDTVTNKLLTYKTPFEVDTVHCAVANGGHSYVLGVGNEDNEIWLNSVNYSPAEWEHVGYLSVARRYFGCLWLSNYIVSTGGYGPYNSTELFDTNTWTTQTTGNLVNGRDDHQMFVLDRKPAVVGGNDYLFGTTALSSIETYDMQTGTWTAVSQQLTTARLLFGLAQFIDNSNKNMGSI